MDILAALAAVPQPGEGRCKLQRIIDDIPDDAPGRDDLLAAVDDPKGYPSKRLALVMRALGTPVGDERIQDHRGKRCVCYR